MFSVKIFNNKKRRNSIFNHSILNIISFIKESLNKNIKIISDNNCIEVFSKDDDACDNGDIVAELLIKKRVVINIDDLNDRARLDKYIVEIKHFCEKAAEIENVEYMPINFRNLNSKE